MKDLPPHVREFAELIARRLGKSPEAVIWSMRRMHHLMRVEGKAREEAKEIIKGEIESEPWVQ